MRHCWPRAMSTAPPGPLTCRWTGRAARRRRPEPFGGPGGPVVVLARDTIPDPDAGVPTGGAWHALI
ncbi:hypothetical protein CBM2605_B130134 [Cupriavidus neocaledonicus]|uniref:Uncharacterized protein n=1 Tax=Cupriavidus neocaledonicus TaxID=1040979 RepID=A0ABY1V7U9_9BURK|nr:hypothetical protein CBM2605_B130134 [Cupriavidus neocaledonicus]